jgi:tRNA(fMet)-specific endonuclease VapC
MSYLLDTNHCSQIILQNADLLYQLAQHSEAKLFTSAIVQGELIDMVGRSQQKASNLLLTQVASYKRNKVKKIVSITIRNS